MESNIIFQDILKEFHLGSYTAQPQRVTGGYLHKMYKLETTTGKYAVKLLNPVIMKRPDALQNFQRAECLEKVLAENAIPVIPAIEINGRKMQCIHDQFFYIFRWVEGKALGWNEIEEKHCRIAGMLLAKIHKIEQIEKPFTREKICTDWDAYIGLVSERCPEIVNEIKPHRELLYLVQEEYNSALECVPDVICICDGDMDSKNVLWTDGNPMIIDLECLDYDNPFLEMFQLALSWSGGVVCDIDYKLLDAFITSYHQEYGDFKIQLKELYGIGFSWLEWLEYNLKRAMMIECENEEERQLGIGQVRETIQRIVYFASVKDELLSHLSAVDCKSG